MFPGRRIRPGGLRLGSLHEELYVVRGSTTSTTVPLRIGDRDGRWYFQDGGADSEG